jgi:hypothetical protein
VAAVNGDLISRKHVCLQIILLVVGAASSHDIIGKGSHSNRGWKPLPQPIWALFNKWIYKTINGFTRS